MFINWEKMKSSALAQKGKPYEFGFKPDYNDPSPAKFDCSSFVKWCYAQIGIYVPDGSYNLFDASLVTTHSQFGDLVFLRSLTTKAIDHVGIVLDSDSVIEAHGSRVFGDEPKYQVVTRSRSIWEKQPDYAGCRRLRTVSQ